MAEHIDDLITLCEQATDRCFEVLYSLLVNVGNEKEVFLTGLFHRLLFNGDFQPVFCGCNPVLGCSLRNTRGDDRDEHRA